MIRIAERKWRTKSKDLNFGEWKWWIVEAFRVFRTQKFKSNDDCEPLSTRFICVYSNFGRTGRNQRKIQKAKIRILAVQRKSNKAK